MLTRHIIAVGLLFASQAEAQEARLKGDLPRQSTHALRAIDGLEIEYGSVRSSGGYRLRTILSRPSGTTKKLPALFLTQWVSCGSLDFDPTKPGLLRDIATKSGMVFIRVERAGSGDSEGPACSALDYDTEVRDYRAALDQLARHPWVDPSNIVIFGSSLGATTAPLVAQGKMVAGIVVQGGGALTYLERMINFDRLYLERSGKYPASDIHDEMVKRIPFHVEYLLGAKTPEQIGRERPELAGVWQSIRGGAEAPPHYGRPYAWHWQAARKDFLEAWLNVRAPLLIFYGEHDQFETRHGHELIAQQVNRVRPGSATFIQVPGADHDVELYSDAESAYAYRNPTVRRELLLTPMLDWLRKVTRPQAVGSAQ